jgi:transposase InsO family protein
MSRKKGKNEKINLAYVITYTDKPYLDHHLKTFLAWSPKTIPLKVRAIDACLSACSATNISKSSFYYEPKRNEFEHWYNSWRPHITLDGNRPDEVLGQRRV